MSIMSNHYTVYSTVHIYSISICMLNMSNTYPEIISIWPLWVHRQLEPLVKCLGCSSPIRISCYSLLTCCQKRQLAFLVCTMFGLLCTSYFEIAKTLTNTMKLVAVAFHPYSKGFAQ